MSSKVLRYWIVVLMISCAELALGGESTVLFIGDSLTAGYGIDKAKSYPEITKQILAKKFKKKIKVINGGLSGSTSASANSRIKWFLRAKPDILILALGANDGLRGIDLKQTQKNLEGAIKLAQSKNIKVVLAGMLIPPNYGPKYTKQFKALYQKIKKTNKVTLIPFLLEKVAGEKQYNLADGIHPNEKGHQVIAETVAKHLKVIL